MANGSSIVVEHLPHHLKVEGLCLATAADTEMEKMEKVYVVKCPAAAAQRLNTRLIIEG